MSGILWGDDRQISYMEIHKSVDRADPRVEIEILEGELSTGSHGQSDTI